MGAKLCTILRLSNSDFSSFCTENTQLASHYNCLCVVLTLQFAQDVLPMVVDRIITDIQMVGYLFA